MTTGPEPVNAPAEQDHLNKISSPSGSVTTQLIVDFPFGYTYMLLASIPEIFGGLLRFELHEAQKAMTLINRIIRINVNGLNLFFITVSLNVRSVKIIL